MEWETTGKIGDRKLKQGDKMDDITQEEYTRIMDEHDELVDLIITRTVELANILHGRDPVGTCCETDFDVKDDGTLLVQFEEYYCGDSDTDSYYLPLEFLFSEDYRKNYKSLVEKERYEKEQSEVQRLIEREEEKLRSEEEYDKVEYERLKKKYEATI